MPEDTIPQDLGSIADLSQGRLSWLGRRYLQRVAEERRVTTYKLGRRLFLSAGEVEALVTARPRFEA